MELTRGQLVEMMDANNGDLDLSNIPTSKLPDNLTVSGSLKLGHETEVEVLPDGLVVGRSLDIRNSKVREIGEQVRIGGSLSTGGSKLEKIGRYLRVEGSFIPGKIPLEVLPADLFVGRNLMLADSSIKRLSSPTTVLGEMMLADYSTYYGYERTWIRLEALPAGLTVGTLCLVPQVRFKKNCPPIAVPEDITVLKKLVVHNFLQLAPLPDGLVIRGDLETYLIDIPRGLTVGGNCKLCDIDKLPPDLKVGGVLDLREGNFNLHGIPGSVEVGGDLLLPRNVNVIGANLTVGGDLIVMSRFESGDFVEKPSQLEIRSGVKVGGTLNIGNTRFVACLPDDMKIGKGILGVESIRALPETLEEVNGDLRVGAKRLPRGLRYVAGSLTVPMLPVAKKYLPEGLVIGDDLCVLSQTRLPNNLAVGGNIILNCPIDELPENLELYGEVVIGQDFQGMPCLKIKSLEDFLKLAKFIKELPDWLEVKDFFAEMRLVIAPVEAPED